MKIDREVWWIFNYLAYGKGSAAAIAKYQDYKSRLKNEMGGIEKVINTLKYHRQKKPNNKKLKTELEITVIECSMLWH